MAYTSYKLTIDTFTFKTEPCTNERYLEVINTFDYILDCQKKYWKNEIKKLFYDYTRSEMDKCALIKDPCEELPWQFHRILFMKMCFAWSSE